MFYEKIFTPKLSSPVFHCLFFLNTSLLAQNGSLDAAFGNDGKVITDFGGPKDYATCMALQKDQKIIVGGFVTLDAKQQFALVRYNANGTPDTSFGTNGKVTTAFNAITEVYLEAIKLQPDGKIVAGGYLLDGVNDNFVLVRYNTTGSPDSSFGSNGIIITPLTGNNNRATSIEIDTVKGYIVVAGSIDCKPAVRRYALNGSTSLFFAELGVDVADPGDCYNTNIVALFATGQVLLTGEVDGPGSGTGSAANMFLMKLNTTGQGSVDSTFGNNGTVKTRISDTSGAFASLVLPGGKIIIAGFAAPTGGNRQFVLAGYKPNGNLDSTFGTNGEVIVPFSQNSTAHSIELESNGNIVVTGTTNNGVVDEIVALVFTPSGKIDSTFGNNGRVLTDNGLGDDGVATAVQADGKLVVAGYTLSEGATGYDFIVARYNTDVSLPVKLASFTAYPVKNTVSVNWATASEINNSYFDIERSAAASNFVAIGRVSGHGNTNQLQQYQYFDAQPLVGDNYYRLRQVDKDGRSSYSKIVHIVFGAQPFILAYPNPAKNTVKIGGLNAAASLSIIDMSGKMLHQYTATGSDYTINIQNLAAGVYFIRVKQGNTLTTLKLVKQ